MCQPINLSDVNTFFTQARELPIPIFTENPQLENVEAFT